MNRAVIVAAALTLFSGQQVLADPLNSGNWEWVKDYLFEDAETVFDDRVVVKAPKYAEDNMNVPFVVDARALDDVQEIRGLCRQQPDPPCAHHGADQGRAVHRLSAQDAAGRSGARRGSHFRWRLACGRRVRRCRRWRLHGTGERPCSGQLDGIISVRCTPRAGSSRMAASARRFVSIIPWTQVLPTVFPPSSSKSSTSRAKPARSWRASSRRSR